MLDTNRPAALITGQEPMTLALPDNPLKIFLTHKGNPYTLRQYASYLRWCNQPREIVL